MQGKKVEGLETVSRGDWGKACGSTVLGVHSKGPMPKGFL